MSDNQKNNYIFGIALIVFGLLILLYNVGVLHLRHWWPLILVALGVAFFVGWFNDRNQTGLLLPGAILVILGFQFWFLHAGWQIYVLAPAVGFWLMYFLGPRDVGLLIPAIILTLVAVVFWFEGTAYYEYWPVLFIIAGIILILLPGERKGSKISSGAESESEEVSTT
ncbi:MAG: hypothetical protein GF372_08345 [Candidatus Marinimicrobia bacterium]|nr:hypothetical protein [Candidatus Neomarinimicrobiota bacterium]